MPSYSRSVFRLFADNESRVRFLALLALPCVLCAQDRPQFVWQGEVDGVDILYLHGNKLEVKVQEGAAVAGQRFQFYEALPEIRQDVRVEVRDGRGSVHIVDQPRLENSYTLGVAIEDRQPGSSFYSIALYWDASSRFFEGSRPGRSGQVRWSGRVDEDAIISCQAKTCVSSTSHGVPVANERFKFSTPLPARDLEVTLEDAEGRGEVHLVEQPRESNRYIARVSIRDPQSGAGEYSFTLVWNRAPAKPSQAPPLQIAEPGLFWSSVVEGRVRVTVQGGSALSEVIEGRPISGEYARFARSLPSRADLTLAIKKIHGRGRVEIVERPSAANHFRLVFEITPAGDGPDNYEVEVDW